MEKERSEENKRKIEINGKRKDHCKTANAADN